ncbi:deoxyribose-phosphate aldolase, partial [Propionibacterium freudenreichii]|nr:deoxyribose-phosphate aldolase [Propionibacterium freudenreichii]
MSLLSRIVDVRMHHPERIAERLTDRPRGTMPAGDEKLMIIACDHPARGALSAGGS